MARCDCGGGWESSTGHRISCPAARAVGAILARLEERERGEREHAERGRWVAQTFVHADDMPAGEEI